MIIQCDQCNAKFKLDDSKVKEEGTKVRCSKCKHIFFVQKQAPAEEADFDSLLNGLVSPPAGPFEEPGETALPEAGRPAPEAGKPTAAELPPTGEQADVGFPEREGFDFGEFDFDAGPVGAPPAASAEEKEGFDFGELDLDRGDLAGSEVKTPEGGMPSFDENTFSFAEEAPPPVPEFEIEIEGFGGPEAADEPAAGIASSSGEEEKDFFAPSSAEFSFEPEAVESKAGPAAPEQVQEEQPASFEFDELEFGEAAPPSEKPEMGETPSGKPEEFAWEEPEPSHKEPAEFEWEKQELPPQEPIGAPGSPEVSATPIPGMPMAEEELPPLSIASRRRGVSILPIAVTAVSVLLIIGLAVGGYYLYKDGPAAFSKVGLGFVAKWFGLDAREEGSIGVRNPVGAFLNNTEAGELFVVTGEAVNNFAKPRASIQVKATLYGPEGEVLQHKTAYCGNALSKEQLATLPVAKLEAAMANQFGDSLSNLAVQPGKAIPFVVVFTNVPKEAADFGVEVVGSTVASQ